mgnify:CR=1 FL=1
MDDSRIIKTEYSEEMQKSFIDYAMTVSYTHLTLPTICSV